MRVYLTKNDIFIKIQIEQNHYYNLKLLFSILIYFKM